MKYIGGLPADLFDMDQPDYRYRDVKGLNGSYMLASRVLTGPGRSMILGDNSLQCWFKATLADHLLTANIKTRDQYGNPHPDIHAGKVFRRTTEIFEQSGHSIDAFKGEWLPTSTNRLEYINLVAQGVSPTEAVLQTWTGQILQKSLGINKVESMREIVSCEGNNILEVVFRR